MSRGRAYADPAALRAFAERLSAFCGRVDNMRQDTAGALNALGGNWEDEQYSQFCSAFGETYRRFEQFLNEARQALPQIIKDAEALERFQRQNLP